LLETGNVLCWGENTWGQLGQGSTSNLGDDPGEVQSLTPIELSGTVKAVKAGFRFVCAQLTTNQLRCWGRNSDGQLGINETAHRGDNAGELGAMLPVVSLGAGLTVVDFAAGYTHTCALLSNQTVKCWGGEADGGTGYGDPLINRGDGIAQVGETTMGMEMGANLPALDLTSQGIPARVAAARHTCILFQDATVGCFGRNSSGELGIGNLNARGDQAGEMGASFLKAPLGTGLLAIAVITGHEEGTNDANSCALLGNGELKCWGANVRGQLGLGDALPRGDMPGELGDELPATLDLWD
jgi:alpha-tubulin suppressor-like RCC1 family protein